MSLRRTLRVAPEAFVNAEGACRKAPFETPCPRVSHNSGSSVLHDVFRALRTEIKDPERMTQRRAVNHKAVQSIFTTFDYYRKSRSQ